MAAGRLLLPSWMPALDGDGFPIPNAKVYFYLNLTTTLAPVYEDEALSIPLANPVEANSSGRFPAVWADGDVLYSASVEAPYGPAGVPFTYDNLSASLGADILIAGAAEAAANESVASAAASEAALAEIQDIVANAPDAPSVVNKANKDGGNITSGADWRTALGLGDSAVLDVGTVAGTVAAGDDARINGALQNTFALPATGGVSGASRSVDARMLDSVTIYAADFGVVSGSSGAATSNSTAINALMAYIAGLGGGRLILPRGSVYVGATLDNKYPGVLVEGYMRSRFHDGGSPQFGTTIVPTEAFTPLKHRTPFAAEQGLPAASVAKNTGGGFKSLRVVGNAVAPRLLEVTSVASAEYDLYLESAVGDAAAYFTAGISGTDMGEAADVQSCSIYLNIRQIDTGSDSAHGVVFDGSSNANVSLNPDIRIFAQHKNGHAVFGRSMDNNDLWVIATRVAGGTGKTVLLGDAADYDPNIGGNTFHRLSGNGGGHLLGTDTAGAIANFNTVVNYDDGNGSPVLTAGTGSRWMMLSDTFGYASGTVYGPTAFGGDRTQATAARDAMTGETVRIRNGGSAHVIIDDTSGNVWAVRINGAGGDLDILRLAGTGFLQLPDVSILKIGGNQVSVGAVDSGGTGFRLLRYPN